MGLTYRHCSPGDEKLLAVFHQELGVGSTSPEFWRWKYFENPSGGPAIYLALDGERIIGTVGEVPVRVKVADKEVLAAQGVDIYVHEGYRGGITVARLERFAREASKLQGAVMDFAFAIEITTKIFCTKRIGFTITAPVRKCVKILNPTPYLARVFKAPFIAEMGGRALRHLPPWRASKSDGIAGITEVSVFDARFDRLWADAGNGHVMVVRDSLYLNWRYLKCPAVDYKVLALEREGRLKGYVVIQLVRRRGQLYGNIADILAVKGEVSVINSLLEGAVRRCRQEGAIAVMTWFPKGSALGPSFRSMGFLARSISTSLIVRTFREDVVPLEVLTKEGNWYYTPGDSDYLLAS